MPTILFLEVDTEDQPRIQQRFSDAEITDQNITEYGLDKASGFDVISGFIYSKFDTETIKALPNLKLLCTRSVGTDHIDLDTCTQNGIAVCNVPDYGSHVIAEHVFALLLSTLRHIPQADAQVESGEFDYHGLRGMALRGKTIGIVGTGKIGRRVAQIAHGFGMRIVATDRCRTTELTDLLGVSYVLFENLLQQSDIITLHLPAIAETEHMICTDTIDQMKEGVVLVNTARGSLIDSGALLDALQNGKVSHALLDVLEHEKNFEENKALIEHPNVVSTPHIAFYADDSMRNMMEDCVESIDAWTRGEDPDHLVKPPKIICDLPGIQKT